jgi:hypothetical protein
MAPAKCATCKKWVAGDREHEIWCPDMPDWQFDQIDKEASFIAALEHIIAKTKEANDAKAIFLRMCDRSGFKSPIE